MILRALFLLCLGAALLGRPTPGFAEEEPPVVAAASDLQFALPELASTFRAETGREVRLVLGSSGNFFRQIQEGAPFQLYFSADEQFVLDLAEGGFTEDEGALYAVGRLALVVPNGSPLEPDGELADLRAALADGRLTRFAVANPEHAPYGRRAEEALRHAGLWEAIEDRLVLGENVSQAAQFAMSGNAEGGLIAYSLALAPDMASAGRYALVPEDWHDPLRQRMALVKGAGDTARLFYQFVQSPTGREILKRYGFALPDEPM